MAFPFMTSPSLACNLAGISSPNPFWLASAPPTNSAYQVLKAFEAGWGGAVWKTLTDSPIVNASGRYAAWHVGHKRMVGFSNIELISEKTVAQNCAELAEVKQQFPSRPLVASLMFETKAQWQEAVKRVEAAGVDAVELNFGCPHGMSERGMGSTLGQHADLCEERTAWVREVAERPVLVKLTPNVTDMLPMALAAQRAGASALSLINTINSVMGVDLTTWRPQPEVDGASTHGGYCGTAVKPIALHWLTHLLMSPELTLPISGIGGIGGWRDAAEFLLLGASNVQVATAVMHHGFGLIDGLTAGLADYLSGHGLQQVQQLQGQALAHMRPWAQLNLAYQQVAHIDASTCIGCDKCFTACDDGAYQAIGHQAGSNVPVILSNCVGCNLCAHVCPVAHCITMQPVASSQAKPPVSWETHPLNPRNNGVLIGC
jgi:dihydropyrimidine dehydrogenase (NAD+) subunit PreA